MKSFEFTMRDSAGIHARPAGLLVRMAQGYSAKITIEKGGSIADCTRLFGIMGLGVKKGDTVKICADGADEDTAIIEIKNLFEEKF